MARLTPILTVPLAVMSRKKPRPVQATSVGHTDSAWAAALVWLVSVLGVGWAAWNLRGGYFFYDDWAMIGRVLHTTPVEGMTTGYNGHLWMLQDWIYRIQVFGFGVDDNFFIRGAFVCALLLLHLSLAALLRASGLSRLSSMMLGGLLTYLGAAAENYMWPVQVSPTLAVAAGVAAAAIALRHAPAPVPARGPAPVSAPAVAPASPASPAARARALPPGETRTPSPAPTRVAAVVVLSLLSVGIDSAIALMSVTLAAGVTFLAWRGLVRFAGVPAMAALGLWILFADRGPEFPADFATRAAFAVRLVLYSAGGVFGLGQQGGIFVLIVSSALVAFGFHKGYLDRRSRIMLAAGSLSALLVAGALTVARAGIVGLDFTNGSRYLHNVIIPATLAAAPAIAATCRQTPPGAGQVLIVVAFLLGLVPKQNHEVTFRRYNAETREGIRSAAAIIREGCPSGAAPNPASTPLDYVGPQVTTKLVRELLDRGLLEAPPPRRLSTAVAARMCDRLPVRR